MFVIAFENDIDLEKIHDLSKRLNKEGLPCKYFTAEEAIIYDEVSFLLSSCTDYENINLNQEQILYLSHKIYCDLNAVMDDEMLMNMIGNELYHNSEKYGINKEDLNV